MPLTTTVVTETSPLRAGPVSKRLYLPDLGPRCRCLRPSPLTPLAQEAFDRDFSGRACADSTLCTPVKTRSRLFHRRLERRVRIAFERMPKAKVVQRTL